MQLSVFSESTFARLGTDTDNIEDESECTERTKKMRPPGESGSQRPKRRKNKLIRLDDLIPKQDVRGGHQVFGATDTQQTNQNKKEE
jgi:hypothetical protein